jgi:hypothetical protein
MGYQISFFFQGRCHTLGFDHQKSNLEVCKKCFKLENEGKYRACFNQHKTNPNLDVSTICPYGLEHTISS